MSAERTERQREKQRLRMREIHECAEAGRPFTDDQIRWLVENDSLLRAELGEALWEGLAPWAQAKIRWYFDRFGGFENIESDHEQVAKALWALVQTAYQYEMNSRFRRRQERARERIEDPKASASRKKEARSLLAVGFVRERDDDITRLGFDKAMVYAVREVVP